MDDFEVHGLETSIFFAKLWGERPANIWFFEPLKKELQHES
jgi:hypothetical protein